MNILSTFFLTAILLCAQTLTHADTRILYIRHGEVPGNDPSPNKYIYTGCGTDEALTEKGQAQAEKCARDIAYLQDSGLIGKVSAIYASDLQRALQTAQPIAEALHLEVQPQVSLREIYWGGAEGQLVKEMTEQWGPLEKQVKQTYPDRKIRWDHLPVFEGAETYNALLKQSLAELTRIGELHKDETVIVVGHGRVLKTLIADAKDSEERIPYPANCGIAEFSYSTDGGVAFVKVFEDL